MSKAEERAMAAYPEVDGYAANYKSEREAFLHGYKQAEKDLALIPEDMGVIFHLVRKLQYKYNDWNGCLEEALRLFNEARNDAKRGND